MRVLLIKTINEIVTELDGFIFYPKEEKWYDLGIAFYQNKNFFFDHIDFKMFLKNTDCEILLKSGITAKRYVPLSTYTFLLVESLEKEFGITISMKPTTSRFYFTGELLNQKINFIK